MKLFFYITESYVLSYPSLPYHSAGDSTARIWTIGEGPCSANMQGILPNCAVLTHFKGKTPSKDVTTLDWNVSIYCIVLEYFVRSCFTYA